MPEFGSQLEHLARPFPSKYIKAPAQGKYGSYVPHDVVQQALLAVLGPVDIAIGEVFKGEDGKIEGCLVTLTAEIDGRRASVTEVGDCENPTNWKTQGARMKDAISDGVKRCAMRLGCGLHLWAQDDYFLYDYLRKQSQPPQSLGEHPVPAAEEAGPVSSPDRTGPALSKARVQTLAARALALRTDHVDVDGKQKEWNLPDLDHCDEKQAGLWEEMLTELEAALSAPM